MPRFLARRTVLLYVLGIVVPAVVLLFLAWRSIEQQRAAMAALSERNIHLNVERLAADTEQQVGSLSMACVQDSGFGVLAGGSEPEPVAARRVARDILLRHPIAAHVFLAQGDLLRYPVAHAPLMRDVSSASGSFHEFATLIAHAEQLERGAQDVGEPLALYQQAAALRVPPALHALALARIARCEQRSGRVREASDTWIELASLVRRRARSAFTAGTGWLPPWSSPGERNHPALESAVATAYEDLTSGRWVLAAEQVDVLFCPSWSNGWAGWRVGGRTHLTSGSSASRGSSATASGRYQPPRPTQVSSSALGPHAEFPIAYTMLGDAIAGCSLNLDWVQRAVLSPLAARAGLSQDTAVSVEPRRNSASLDATGTSLTIRQPFGAALRDFDLTVRGRPHQTSGLTGGTWAFAGATAVTIGALAFGVFLLLRDVARQRDTNRLREDLVSAVSHELKTPLTLIRVYAETLAEDPGADETERGGSVPDHRARESERLGRG